MSIEASSFMSFVLSSLGGMVATVAFYIDETKPGNVLRLDMARSINSVFWGITQLPAWFRPRREFWWIFANIPSRTMHMIAGGGAALLLKILETFWSSDGMNLHRLGVRVKSTILRCRYAFIMVDEKMRKGKLWGEGRKRRSNVPHLLQLRANGEA